MHERLHDPWPGPFENLVIDAMLNDRDSPHWSECQGFVSMLVLKWANDFSADAKEEITQNAMFWIVRYLPTFKRECKLTTWLVRVVHTRIVDAVRERQTSFRWQTLPPSDLFEDDENEAYISKISSPRSAEEECILREELREASTALLKHLSTRANSQRNSLILEMHFAGFSQEDIARKLNIPAPNIGYVIRTFQRLLREEK